MEKYKVKKSVILNGLTSVDPATEIHINIESNSYEIYSLFYMSTTREEIEHYVIDNYDKFISLPTYDKIGYFDIVDEFLKDVNNKELTEKCAGIRNSGRWWVREFDGLLIEYSLFIKFCEFRKNKLKLILDDVILKFKDKIEVIDDLD
jgi:hypothetical protein